jgi:hypothetical protein
MFSNTQSTPHSVPARVDVFETKLFLFFSRGANLSAFQKVCPAMDNNWLIKLGRRGR